MRTETGGPPALLEEKRARADALEQSAAGLQIPYGEQERILRGRALQQQWRDVQEQVKQAEADLSAALQNLNEASGQQDRARAGLIRREAAVRAAQAALEEHLALLDRRRQENAAASLSALLHEGDPALSAGPATTLNPPLLRRISWQTSVPLCKRRCAPGRMSLRRAVKAPPPLPPRQRSTARSAAPPREA